MLIVFSHGNSFPAGTYSVLFKDLRARGFIVKAVEKFGHDPKYPVSNNWRNLVEQLADFTAQEMLKAGEPVFLVGHSLGGFLSLMAASLHPEIARGVVMLDSPLIGGWRAATLGVMKRAQLVEAVSPGAVSKNRRNSWPDSEDTFAYFKGKKAFARWDEQVLRDYLRHGLHEEGEGAERKWVLGFDREIETAIYNTLPHNLGPMLRRAPLKCPAAFIGGRQSVEMRKVGMAMTQRVTKGRIAVLDGTHLFPMEKPVATAAAIEAAIRGFDGA